MAMKLALGPLLYFWDREQVFDFYRAIASAPVDIVYLGEVVCAKRRALTPVDWLHLADYLARSGKEVVLSTLALIEAESELASLKRIAANGRFQVEANDYGAVDALAGQGPFVAGPHLNTYNVQTLQVLAEAGARRWVAPVELDAGTIADLHAGRPAGLETEVFAYGRLPLAFSARCFTARAHNLPKDRCGFACARYPDGMGLKTREGEPFLVLNGIQTQSARTYNLLGAVSRLEQLGVEVLRLSPQAQGMSDVIGAFRAAVDNPDAPVPRLAADAYCDGYWAGGPGMQWRQGA